MQRFERYDPEHPEYPRLLNRLLTEPPSFTATGPLPYVRAVAIVGSRNPVYEAAVFANDLARDLAKAGMTIVSGGATGIDAAAHRGALEVGGATWVVCPTGKNHVAPQEHGDLFREIAESPRGRVIWPFEDNVKATRETFRRRNQILVALSEAVVVVQAGLKSGSRNACTRAKELGKSLWVVAAPPWGHWPGMFSGSAAVLNTDKTANLLGSKAQLFAHLHLARGAEPELLEQSSSVQRSLKFLAPRRVTPDESWTDDEKAMLSVVSDAPKHREILAEKAGLPIGSASTALLTLSLKDVVVEGPDGFYRRTLAS